jgi:plasmid stabilization system protein ParE
VRRIEFAPAARAELDHAVDYYEADYPRRGLRFYNAVERAVRAAAATPLAGPLYPGLPEVLGVRRRVVPGFPYVLAYRYLGDLLRIEAVVHGKRKPRHFARRLK